MKITMTLYATASDTNGGTDNSLHTTEREAEDHILGLIGQDRETFDAQRDEFWDFVEANRGDLDTFSIESYAVTATATRNGEAATVEIK